MVTDRVLGSHQRSEQTTARESLVWLDEVLLSESALLDRQSAAFFPVINNLSQ